jgi:hypothetical protein
VFLFYTSTNTDKAANNDLDRRIEEL